MAISSNISSIYNSLNEISQDLHLNVSVEPPNKKYTVADAREKLEMIVDLIHQDSSLILKDEMSERIATLAANLGTMEHTAKPSQGFSRWIKKIGVSLVNTTLPSEKAYDSILALIKAGLEDQGISEEAIDSLSGLIDFALKQGTPQPEQIKILVKVNILQVFLNLITNANKAYYGDQKNEGDPCFLVKPFAEILKEVANDLSKKDREEAPELHLENYASRIVDQVMKLGFPEGSNSIIFPPSTLGKIVSSIIDKTSAFEHIKELIAKTFVKPALHSAEKLLQPQATEAPKPETTEVPKPQATAHSPIRINTKALINNLFEELRKAKSEHAKDCAKIIEENKPLVESAAKSITNLILYVIPELKQVKRFMPAFNSKQVKFFGAMAVVPPASLFNALLIATSKATIEEAHKTKPVPSGTTKKKTPFFEHGIDELVRISMEGMYDMYGKILTASFKKTIHTDTFLVRTKKRLRLVIALIETKLFALILPKLIRRKHKVKTKIPTGKERLKPMVETMKQRSGKYAEKIAETLFPPR